MIYYLLLPYVAGDDDRSFSLLGQSSCNAVVWQDDVRHSMTNQTKKEVFKRNQLKIKDDTQFSLFLAQIFWNSIIFE